MESEDYVKKLSVIVPVYNSEKYLGECINSIMAQTAEDMELILVDDGSTDTSGLICDEYSSRYDNIRVFHIDNCGQSYARNIGVIHAQGEYVGFVDSDDWIDVDMYRYMLDYAVRNSLDMVCCGFVYEKKGKSQRKYNRMAPRVYDYDAIQHEILPKALAFGTDYARDRAIEPHVWDKLYKNSIIRKALSEIDETIYLGEDAVTLMKCLLLCNRLGVVDKCFYHYRIHDGSICRGNDLRIISSFSAVLNSLLAMDRGTTTIYHQVRYYAIYAFNMLMRIGLNVKCEKFWLFPFEDFEKEMSIAIYGAGNVGTCYYQQLNESGYFRIVDVFDSKPPSEMIKGPDELDKTKYDKIVVAVDEEETAQAIKQSLLKRGIPEELIYWKKPRWVRDTFRFGF
ncbi:MAG: glycosyltransferase [Eubacterium sp.]|nr:glycosyltransferase [Eubacterium sp.]